MSDGQALPGTFRGRAARVIANWIVQQRHTLRGQEVRFLRSLLDLSQAGLGEVLGVSRPTVARLGGRGGPGDHGEL